MSKLLSRRLMALLALALLASPSLLAGGCRAEADEDGVEIERTN